MTRLFSFCCLLICILINIAVAERIRDMIYMSVDGVAACFRRQNGTHQFGCSSSRSGSVGVIHLLQSEDDIKWLEMNSTAGPYSVVMPFEMFTRNNLLRLKKTENINGVLLAENTTFIVPDHYSPEDTCPNRYSGYTSCDNDNPWNPYGSSLLLEDWPFPMFFMHNQTMLQEIKSCFYTHNAHSRETQNERSLCALEMKSFMYAAINSESCMRRTASTYNVNPILFCDPLGDKNIHWPLAPMNDEVESVILVIARLDSNSLFDEIAPGAASAVTGITTLLATAFYLNSLNATVTKTNIIFSLLNGEAFDYIGSSRFVYDLKHGYIPSFGEKTLTLEQITAVIELGQLGEGKLYLHTYNDEKFELVSHLEKNLPAKVLRGSVPPASVQNFLTAKPNMTSVVIANHGKQFVNRYYHSLLDNADTLDYSSNKTNGLATSLATVAVTFGNELYKMVTGNSPTVDKSNFSLVEDLVSNILPCYLESARCDLFQATTPPGTKIANRVLPLYVSVVRVSNPATFFTGQLLAFLTGTKFPNMNSSTCLENHLLWMGGYNFSGLCVNATVKFTDAVSPAFVIEDYDMKSGIYSTWTESVWQTLSVRMFLKPSPATERLSMILGNSVAIFSFILVWFINSRADILFNSSRTVDL